MNGGNHREVLPLLLTSATLLCLWLALAGLRTFAAPVAQATDGAEISAPPVVSLPWAAQSSENTTEVQGQVTLGGAPVAGAHVAVGGYRLPEPTDAQGQFTFPANHNVIQRYPVQVVAAADATINGEPLSTAQQEALEEAEGSINVHYETVDVAAHVREDGSIAITGTLQFRNGDAPPPVVLYSYRLTGTVTVVAGEPIADVIVSTQTPEFRWTLSEPTGPQGHYRSIYWPTETAPFRVLLVEGNDTYPVEGDQGIVFPLYQSARMDVTLDRSAGTITVTEPVAIAGRIYDGLLIGVMQEGEPVQPISATWPITTGQFHLVLPSDLAGQEVQWWQWQTNYFSTIPAEPGGQIDVSEWPDELPPRVPRNFATITLPGGE